LFKEELRKWCIEKLLNCLSSKALAQAGKIGELEKIKFTLPKYAILISKEQVGYG
jgi:hypothetical protein